MIGGAYLCYEGTEKVYEAVVPHSAHAHEAEIGSVALEATSLEDEKVASAIKTDFILSAEIMAISLAAIPDGGFWTKAITLAVVGIAITVAVYGVVALIVKADDAGVALAANDSPRLLGKLSRALGRALVLGMPGLLTDAQRAWHRGDDLGRRRHHRARAGWLRFSWPRACDP